MRKRPIGYHYSIVVDGGEGDEAPPRRGRFHVLYQGVGPIVRTMHLPTLARAFVSELESWLLLERDDAVYARCAPIAMNGTKLLVPGWLVSYVGELGRRVEKAGLTLPLSRWSKIDPATGVVLPTPSLLEVPPGAIDDLGPRHAADECDVKLATLDSPVVVAGVVTYNSQLETIAATSRGLALARLAISTANIEKLGGRAVDGLRRVIERAACYETGLGRRRQMLSSLLAVFEDASRHDHDHATEEVDA